MEKMYGGNVGRQLNISNVLLVKEMKMKDNRIEELQVTFDIYFMCSEIYIYLLHTSPAHCTFSYDA